MKNRQPQSGDRRKSPAGVLPLPPGREVVPDFGLRTAAFSLIEILVVIALLSIIVLGLMAMFSQTQKAFRAGLSQTDVLASGRLATDMLGRELEQITPAYQFGTNFDSPNFYAQIPYDAATYNTPFSQPLPGNLTQRTNLIHDLFFVSKLNQDWVGIGYFVRANNPVNGTLSLSPFGVGNLYRFETNATVLSRRTLFNLFDEFKRARTNENLVINGKIVNRATKLAEGVVSFKVHPFDPSGMGISNQNSMNISAGFVNYANKTNLLGGEIELYAFQSNAVPGAVELELGILEDKPWQRFKAMPSFGGRPTAQEKYLTNQVGRVHLFRQRVAVRNLDTSAYP